MGVRCLEDFAADEGDNNDCCCDFDEGVLPVDGLWGTLKAEFPGDTFGLVSQY